MNKKGKIRLLFNGLGIVLVIALMAFQRVDSDQQYLNNIEIELNQPVDQYFISREELLSEIQQEYRIEDSIHIKEINIKLLEDKIEEIPFVDKAEVYSTLDGRLTAVVNQNTAIARVQDVKKEYYLDAFGRKMPLSSQYSAMVPRVTGHVDSTNLSATHQILKHTLSDPFYKTFFAGIHFIEKDITLYPSNGYYTIQLGRIDNMTTKLENFKIFYQSMVNDTNIMELDEVKLMYENQVVYSNN